MDIVDAQVHAFFKLQENEMLAAMDALGIRAVIIDELWGHLENWVAWPHATQANGVRRALSPLAQVAALKHPDRFAFVQRVNRADPELAALFAILGTTPGCRAVRVDLRSREERQAFASGGFDELLGLARERDLTVGLHIHGRDTAEVLRGTLGRFADVRFVLDHCGYPKAPEQWDSVLSLGACPNLWLKWCHAHHFFEAGPYPFPGLQKQLLRAVDSYGAERVLWASDITHDHGNVSWADLLYYVRESPSLSAGDREWLLSRAARAAYQWPTAVGAGATAA
ncbi:MULTISPECIES: amidohydrolase [unclassified Variovorax]|uniref:amidohydrolase family protein n=1 Tax=unclassified Variovorax TaxID=663243 RepID=UPI001BD48B88|nr:MULTISPECIES: amidohydrolase family protein [unclassified Variovorax]